MRILWSWFVMQLTGWLPDHPAIMRLRGRLLGLAMRKAGRDFQVASRARIVGLENIAVGDHVYVANGAWIDAEALVTVGDEVLIGPYVVISADNHSLLRGSYRFGKTVAKPVSIGPGAWLGAHASVLAGVSIGTGALVGAGAVVTRDIPDFAIAGGAPARVLRLADGARQE